MSHNLRMTALAAALALAGTSAQAATGIQFDPDASGGGVDIVTFNGLGNQGADVNGGGNMVLVGGIKSGAAVNDTIDGSAFIAGWNAFSQTVSGTNYIFTYEYMIPVNVKYTVVGGLGGTLNRIQLTDDTANRASSFRLYLDADTSTSPNFDLGTGIGNGIPGPFGDAGLNSGQHLLATGSVTINNSSFNLTEDLTLAKGDLADNRQPVDPDPVKSNHIEGSVSLSVDITAQTAYAYNDLVDVAAGTPDLTVDMSLNSLGPLAPFDPNVYASLLVAGNDTHGNVSPTNNSGFFGDYNTLAEALGGAPTTESVWNSLECGALAVDNCGGQYQTSVAVNLTSQLLPEPASLALLGLGLAGIGFGARRRKS